MPKERQTSASYVQELLKRSRMPRNQVAAISGLSNAYIRVLERGETSSVRREKLIAFAVALNMDLHETDELLAKFDRTELTLDDIPTFLETSRQMKISSALIPLRDAFMIELLFLAIEQVPGQQIIVNDRPTSCLRPEGFRDYSCRSMADVHPIHSELIEAIGRERKQNLVFQLKQNTVINYIQIDSLEEYIHQCEDPEELKWRIKHIETTIQHIKDHPHFKLFLTRTVPSFLFSLKLPADTNNESPKLAFIGKQIDFFMGKGSGRLAGFATDNQVVIENFQADMDLLKENVLEAYLDPCRLETYLESLLLQKCCRCLHRNRDQFL